MNKFFKAAVKAIKVVVFLAVVAVPADLMVRGADSFFGTWIINTMAGV